MDTEKIKLRSDLDALSGRVQGVDALEQAMSGRVNAMEQGQAELSSRIEELTSRIAVLEQAAKAAAAPKQSIWLKKKQPNRPEPPVAREGAA